MSAGNNALFRGEKSQLYLIFILLFTVGCEPIWYTKFHIDNQSDTNIQVTFSERTGKSYEVHSIEILSHKQTKISESDASGGYYRPDDRLSYMNFYNSNGDKLLSQDPIDNDLWICNKQKTYHLECVFVVTNDILGL